MRIAPILITGAGNALEGHLAPNEARRADRFSRLVLASAKIAFSEAGLAEAPRERIGLVVGTGLGSLETTAAILDGIADKGWDHADPFRFSDSMDSAAAAHCSISLGILGPSLTISHREISGEMAVIRGALLLWSGDVDAVVVAAGDSTTPEIERLYARLGSTHPPGERAAAVVLEREDAALRRGARPIGRLLGWGQVSGDRARAGLHGAGLDALAHAREAASRDLELGPDVLEPEDLSGTLGLCLADGVARVAVALERIHRGVASRAWVARGERGGSAAALLLGA